MRLASATRPLRAPLFKRLYLGAMIGVKYAPVKEIIMRQAKHGLRALLAATLGLLAPFAACAQDANPPVHERLNVNSERREEPIRVQVSINLFYAGPTGESEEAAKLRDRVRRSIYEMAANECTLVEQVLAKTCRLESINVNLNRQAGGPGEDYMAGGNFALRITLK